MQQSDFRPIKASEEQLMKIQIVSEKFILTALEIELMVPAGPHRTAAFRKLLEAKMAAIHAITHAAQ